MATISERSREPHPTATKALSIIGVIVVLGLIFSVSAGLGSAVPRLWKLATGSGWVVQPFDELLGLKGRMGSKGVFQIDCLFFLLFAIPLGLIKLGEGIEWVLDPRARAKSRQRAAEERSAQAAQEEVRRLDRQVRRERVSQRSFRFGMAMRRAVRKAWDGPFATPPISSPVSVGWVLLKVLETTWRLGVILITFGFLLVLTAFWFGS